MRNFVRVRKVSDGVYLIATDGDQALWTRRKLRKGTHCAATNMFLAPGEHHYGPIGNQLYRMCRLYAPTVEQSE